MLPVDLTKTDPETVQIITLLCAEFGQVIAVKLKRTPTPIALVEMSNHEQTMALAGQFGGSAFGTQVLIHLEHVA